MMFNLFLLLYSLKTKQQFIYYTVSNLLFVIFLMVVKSDKMRSKINPI